MIHFSIGLFLITLLCGNAFSAVLKFPVHENIEIHEVLFSKLEKAPRPSGYWLNENASAQYDSFLQNLAHKELGVCAKYENSQKYITKFPVERQEFLTEVFARKDRLSHQRMRVSSWYTLAPLRRKLLKQRLVALEKLTNVRLDSDSSFDFPFLGYDDVKGLLRFMGQRKFDEHPATCLELAERDLE